MSKPGARNGIVVKRVYKYGDTNLFDMLLNQRIKVSSIDSFNDPFEIQMGIDVQNALDNIQREILSNPGLVNDWKRVLKYFGASYDETKFGDLANKIIKFQISQLKQTVKNTKAKISEIMRVICLSERPDIIQMWAHYSEKHIGLVIGFDTDATKPNGEIVLHEMDYSDQMIRLPITLIPEKIIGNQSLIKKLARRKERYWKYEKELRLYLDTKTVPDGFEPIDPRAIKEVYLGLRAPETSFLVMESIKRRPEYKHLKVYQMTKHENEFKLMPKEILSGI